MVLWPIRTRVIRTRVLFELFFKRGIENGSHLFKAMGHEKEWSNCKSFFFVWNLLHTCRDEVMNSWAGLMLHCMSSSYKKVRFMRSCGQRTFPVMHDALNRSLATPMMTITATGVERLIIRWICFGCEQIKLSMVCCTWDTNDPLTLQ